MQIKPALQKAASIAADPGRHLSLEAGDAIALFLLGALVGSIVDAAFVPRVMCWFG